MKMIKIIGLVLLVYSNLSFGWEINTHRAIDRCALVKDEICRRGEVAKNLHWFAENNIPKEKSLFESYVNEKLDGYTLIKYDKDGNQIKGDKATYFNYVSKGEQYGVSHWAQVFSNNFNYTDLIEAGTILEDTLWAGVNVNVTAPILGISDLDNAKGRFNNHFYDPQNNGGGLTYGSGKRVDAITWVEKGNGSVEPNEYTYKKALDYYKNGFTNINPKDRKTYRAKLFVSLGYSLHILNDMNVPAHTRDDSHPLGDPLEVWMRGGEYGNDNGGFKIYLSTLDKVDKDILSKVQAVEPTKYFTYREFYEKAANFTGKNYYSEDSISLNGWEYEHNYTNYSPTKNEVTIPAKEGYITSDKSDILSNHNKIAVKVKGRVWGYNYYYKTKKYNDTLVDNGVNLIPFAVANAEGFINYFFRGRLQASLSDENLTIKNVSNPTLVASNDIVKFNDKVYSVYYETDNNETYHLKDCQAPTTLDVNESFDCDISQELKDNKDKIGKAQKLTIIYDGVIGNERGVSVAIAKKFTNADLLFSFDKSGSMGSDIENAKNSAKDILDTIIGVDNNSTFIEVETFNGNAGVLISYDNNITKAKNAISTIYSGGSTALYDAIKLAGDNAVSHKKASKIAKSILILYTDGLENSSSTTREQAIDAISNAKASEIDEVFLIHVGSGSGASELKSIADEAGRKYLKVDNASALKDAIEKILKGQ